MRDKIKDSLTDLLSAVKVAKFYSVEHPQFKDFISRAFNRLQEIFQKRSEIVIGIVDGELAFEHEIFFDVSEKLRPLLNFLHQRGIQKIAFHRNMDKEELSQFISFLTTRKKKGEKKAQELMDFLGIKNIKAGEIKGSSSEEKEGRIYSSSYEESLDTVSQSLETVMDNEEIDYLELRYSLASNFTGDMMERYQEFLNLTPDKKREFIAFTHLLNTSILSMYVASRMGYSRDDVLDIGTSALFHDIGNIYMSQKLKREGDVSEVREEVNDKRHHSIVGTEILLRYMDKLGVLPVVVAFEHHLRYDLKGEPKVSFPQKLNPVSMVISICDAYDTLVQRRAREDEYPPREIYNMITQQRGRLFDPELLDKFLRIMGVWPVGTMVSLSDESIAVIKEQNENDAYRPKVEVIYPQERREFIDLAERGGDIKIERSLDSIEERKKYLHLTQDNGVRLE